MSGLSALKSKLKYLSTKSFERARAKQISVIYFDTVDGTRVIDFPENMNPRGCLLVPRVLTTEQWIEKHGQAGR